MDGQVAREGGRGGRRDLSTTSPSVLAPGPHNKQQRFKATSPWGLGLRLSSWVGGHAYTHTHTKTHRQTDRRTRGESERERCKTHPKHPHVRQGKLWPIFKFEFGCFFQTAVSRRSPATHWQAFPMSSPEKRLNFPMVCKSNFQANIQLSLNPLVLTCTARKMSKCGLRQLIGSSFNARALFRPPFSLCFEAPKSQNQSTSPQPFGFDLYGA